MPVAIRLKRGGRTHEPYYKVVVVDSRKRTTGRVLEEIGLYHPCARPEPRVTIDKRRALDWLIKGAQPSDTARGILRTHGVLEAFSKGMKPEDLPEEAPAAETPADEAAPAAAEAPAAEAPADAAPAEETPADAKAEA